MNFIVVELCCSSCKRFESLRVINCENYLDLKQILKALATDSDDIYMVYTENGFYLETLFFDID